MTIADNKYYEFLNSVLNNGISNNVGLDIRAKWHDGTPAYAISEKQVFFKYQIDKGIHPITEMRPLEMIKSIQEIMWIYQDQSNELKLAEERGVKWWKNWECKKGFEGTIGMAYGKTVNEYNLIDDLLQGMVKNPLSHRHIINLWQVDHINTQLNLGGLVPCAYETIWSIEQVGDTRVIYIHLNQRSMDSAVTYAINAFQYFALALMIASHLWYTTGIYHKVKVMSHYIHDAHIYERHIPLVKEMIEAYENNTNHINKPLLSLDVAKNFYDITINDFELPTLTTFRPTNKIELAI